MNLLLPWTIRALVLVALWASLFVAHKFVGDFIIDVAQKQQELEEYPLKVARASSLNVELEKRQRDLDRIASYIVSRAGVVDAVTALEHESKRFSVESTAVRIRQLESEEKEERGLVQALDLAEVNVEAKGEANNILEYIYAADHLPYLLSVTSFRLTAAATSLIAAQGVPPPPRRVSQKEAIASKAEITFLLAVKIHDETS